MTKSAQSVLKSCMGFLESQGYSKQRADLALKSEDGEIWQGISIQKRSLPTKILDIALFAVTLWPDFQKALSRGLGLKHSKFVSFSATKYLNPDDFILIPLDCEDFDWMSKFQRIVNERLEPALLKTSTKSDIFAFWESQLQGHTDVVERLIAMRYVESGEGAAREEMEKHKRNRAYPDCDENVLSQFWERLVADNRN